MILKVVEGGGAKVACTHCFCTLYTFVQEKTGASWQVGDKVFTRAKWSHPSPSVAQRSAVLLVYMSFTISVPNTPSAGAPVMKQWKQVYFLLFDRAHYRKRLKTTVYDAS